MNLQIFSCPYKCRFIVFPLQPMIYHLYCLGGLPCVMCLIRSSRAHGVIQDFSSVEIVASSNMLKLGGLEVCSPRIILRLLLVASETTFMDKMISIATKAENF